MTPVHVNSICEVWAKDGPSGDLAEVLEGELKDAGGNLLFAGTAKDCENERLTYRLGSLLDLWPTKVRRLPEGSTGDYMWSLFLESEVV